MHVLLDLWGVLLDGEKMFRGYREEIAKILSARFGGAHEAWLRAHDAVFVSFSLDVNAADRDTERWIEFVDRRAAANVIEMFGLAGVRTLPDDPLLLARQLEADGMTGVDARFPDSKTAIERLRSAGHRTYVATGASEANARGALTGAKLIDLIDGIFTESSQNAMKARRRYWDTIPGQLNVSAQECVLVDDRLDNLEAAASTGIVALLLDRMGAHRPETMPASVQATLRNLAGLPHWVTTWVSEHRP